MKPKNKSQFYAIDGKSPFTKTETHVRDLFTQRYTLMFTQDKRRRGKFSKLNSLKQIGCEAREAGEFLRFKRKKSHKIQIFLFVILTLTVLSVKLVLSRFSLDRNQLPATRARRGVSRRQICSLIVVVVVFIGRLNCTDDVGGKSSQWKTNYVEGYSMETLSQLISCHTFSLAKEKPSAWKMDFQKGFLAPRRSKRKGGNKFA